MRPARRRAPGDGPLGDRDENRSVADEGRILRSPGTRPIGIGLGILFLALGVVCLLAVPETPARTVGIMVGLAVASALGGALCLWRFPGMRIELADDRMTVRGFVVSRVIPREAVTQVTQYGVEWTGGDGARNLTSLPMLPSRGAIAPFGAFREQAMAAMKQWAGLPPGPAPGDPLPGSPL